MASISTSTTIAPPSTITVTAYTVGSVAQGSVEVSPIAKVQDLFKAFEKEFASSPCHFGIYNLHDNHHIGWHSRTGEHAFGETLKPEAVKKILEEMTVSTFAKHVLVVWYKPEKRTS